MSKAKIKFNINELNKLGAVIAEELVDEASKRLLSIAQSSIDFEDNTGTLRESFIVRKGDSSQFSKVVENVSPHAHLMNYGYGIYAGKEGEEKVRVGVVEGKYFMQKAKAKLDIDLNTIINEQKW